VNETAGNSSRLWRRIAFGACAVTAFGAYVTGWPMWPLLLLLIAVPGLSFCVWMWSGRLRRYRFLFAIYAAVVLAGLFEAWQYRTIPQTFTKSIDLPAGRGEPDLFLEGDLPAVMFDLYPDRAESLFVRGFQIKLCSENTQAQRRYRVCEQYPNTDLATIRRCFEQALVLETKTDENLYYHYVEVLMRQNAPQDEIDAAAENWKRLFPLTRRVDPREVFAITAPQAPRAAPQSRSPD
jgi:hypothetical protein